MGMLSSSDSAARMAAMSLAEQVEHLKHRDVEYRLQKHADATARHAAVVEQTKQRHLLEQLEVQDEAAAFEAQIRKLREATARENAVAEDLAARMRLQKEAEERETQRAELERRQLQLDSQWAKQQSEGAARFELERAKLTSEEEQWKKDIEATIKRELEEKRRAAGGLPDLSVMPAAGDAAPGPPGPGDGAAAAAAAAALDPETAAAMPGAVAGGEGGGAAAGDAAAAAAEGGGDDGTAAAAAATAAGVSEADLFVAFDAIQCFLSENEDRAAEVFAKHDADDSGHLDLEEFKLYVHELHLELTDAELKAIFLALDADGSGGIGKEELHDGVAAARRKHLGIPEGEELPPPKVLPPRMPSAPES